MSAQECVDWLLKEEGWYWVGLNDHDGHWRNSKGQRSYYDPFPLTLDGAAKSLKEMWFWKVMRVIRNNRNGSSGEWVFVCEATRDARINAEVYAVAHDELTARYRAAVAAKAKEATP